MPIVRLVAPQGRLMVFVAADMNGTHSTPGASAQPASTNGLKRNAYRATDGRRIPFHTGILSRYWSTGCKKQEGLGVQFDLDHRLQEGFAFANSRKTVDAKTMGVLRRFSFPIIALLEPRSGNKRQNAATTETTGCARAFRRAFDSPLRCRLR